MVGIDPHAPFLPPEPKKPRASRRALAGGVTLRDYFAAHALNGMASRIPEMTPPMDYRVVAKDCYAFADAMLAERGEE